MRAVQILLPLLLLLAGCSGRSPAPPERPAELPELDQVQALLQQARPPPGVQFVIREHDEEALDWLLPRIRWYVFQLHQRWPELHVAILAHGEEIAGLAPPRASPAILRQARALVLQQGVDFHVCGAQAHDMGLAEADFPAFIDVVPYGPSLIRDYNDLGYALIDMELTW